jgi:hypothetical protein
VWADHSICKDADKQGRFPTKIEDRHADQPRKEAEENWT